MLNNLISAELRLREGVKKINVVFDLVTLTKSLSLVFLVTE